MVTPPPAHDAAAIAEICEACGDNGARMTPSTQDARATGLVEEQREGVARIIIGPREFPRVGECLPSLRQLQDIRWEWSSDQERKQALWIADRVIAFLAASTKDMNHDG